MSTFASARTLERVPQNAEIERSLLGAILLNSDTLRCVEGILGVLDFFVPAHRKIFRVMQTLAARSYPVELVTVCDALNGDPDVSAAGGPSYLAKLSEGVHRKAPVDHWARIVRNASILRNFAYAGESIARAALEPGAKAEDLVAQAQALANTYTDPFASAKPSLLALPAEALLAREINPRQMLLDPVLPEQGLVMLYAYRGIGKTYVALGIAAAVANGGTFLRWTARQPRKVLYVDGELAAWTLKQRVAMILAGLEGCEPKSGVFQLVTPDLQDRPMPDLSTMEGQRLFEPLLADVDLVVLDNLSALCRSGNENDGEDWAPVQEWALGLRRRGKSVLLIHHAGKNKSQRGTSRREDLLDTVITCGFGRGWGGYDRSARFAPQSWGSTTRDCTGALSPAIQQSKVGRGRGAHPRPAEQEMDQDCDSQAPQGQSSSGDPSCARSSGCTRNPKMNRLTNADTVLHRRIRSVRGETCRIELTLQKLLLPTLHDSARGV